jgi:hypothetical protein
MGYNTEIYREPLSVENRITNCDKVIKDKHLLLRQLEESLDSAHADSLNVAYNYQFGIPGLKADYREEAEKLEWYLNYRKVLAAPPKDS